MAFSHPLVNSQSRRLTVPPPSTSLTVSKLWPLDRYARSIPNNNYSQVLFGSSIPEHNPPPPTSSSSNDSSVQWKNYDHNEHPQLKMSLIESNHLLITSGHQILESILLWETQKWIKAVAKGDSLLFISNQNNQNRRFRVKFASPLKEVSGIDACREAIESLRGIILVEDISSVETTTTSHSHARCGQDNPTTGGGESVAPSQSQPNPFIGSSQPVTLPTSSHSNDTLSIPIDVIGQNIMLPRELGRAYANTHFPTQQLPLLIRLCLSDSEFPAFVEAIEQELNNYK